MWCWLANIWLFSSVFLAFLTDATINIPLGCIIDYSTFCFRLKMVRNYVKKKTHSKEDETVFQAALTNVLENKVPIRQAAFVHDLNYVS